MQNLIILAWSCLWLAAIQIFSHLLRAFTQGWGLGGRAKSNSGGISRGGEAAALAVIDGTPLV